MKYISLFDQSEVQLTGQSIVRQDSMMLNKKAVFFSTPVDGFTFRVRGRQLGIIFFRHAWGGRVTVWVDDTPHNVELYNATPQHWIFEAGLPESKTVRIRVQAATTKIEASQGMEAWIEAVYVSDYLTSEVPGLIFNHIVSHPLKDIQLNQLTDIFKWYDPSWQQVAARLACLPDYVPPDFIHRKAWEWAQCVYGLEVLGAIQPDHHALGVGVGWEPLSYYFSNAVSV